jgi:murein DD-endopeptidase MepM/ murein hydrolase activator NlpD
MKPARPAITILIHRDGAVQSRTIRIPLWAAKAGLIVSGIGLVAIVAGAALYLPILGVAAQVPGLKSQITGLRAENAQIRRLVTEVDSLESQYAKVRGMLGADIQDSGSNDSPIPQAPPIMVTASSAPESGGGSVPNRWPLDEPGYITRGQLGAGDDATHSGLDIAIPVGSPVRAAGQGTVTEAATDVEYGMYVLLKHEQGYESRYAHLSRIIARAGQNVPAGEVIGLSGNSGRSSAPHLHFEIRRKGQSLDPLTLVKEGR